MNNIFTTIATAGKNRVFGELAKFLLNRLGLEPYGEFADILFDTKDKRITFDLLLKGEEKPVSGTISYHLETSGEDLVMVADSAALSREWMNVVFERHFGPDKRRFIIPPRFHTIIKVTGL